MEKKKKNAGYSSQMSLVLSLIAGAVGTGNIWRFPRVAASNGGGTFIVAWAIMTLCICFSIMLGEHVMGRATRYGAPGAFRDFVGKKFTWMGSVIVIIMIIVAAYYSSVIAWVSYYLGLSFTGGYFGQDKATLFHSVSNGNILTVVLFVVILGISAGIAYTGVRGIEKANKVFLPVLLICLVVVAVRSITLNGASVGLNYLFQFNPAELLNVKIWLEGLTQAVWSAGPGWGLVITLAAFSKAKSDVSLSTATQVFGNASVSLLAAIAVIPAVFALMPESAVDIMNSGNNGLTFISMTSVFESMSGGKLVGIVFFLSLLFAALSSNIVHFMIVSVPLVNSGIKKKKAVTMSFLIMLVLGLPSAYSSDFLSNQDWVAGQMMLVGSLFSCFAMYRFGAKRVRTLLINNEYSGMKVGRIWEILVTFLAPVLVLVMFLWWSIQSISWDPQWWNPIATFSLSTFVVQGVAIVIIAIIFNDKVANSIGRKHFNGKEFPEIPEVGYNN